MKFIITAVLCILSLNAFAGGGRDSVYVKNNGPADNYNDFPNVAKSEARATSKSNATSLSVSEGGSAIANGGSSYAGGGEAYSGGNTLQVNEAAMPDKITVRNTPNLYAPSISPTANCMGSASAGLSLVGFGINGGKSYESIECQRGEWFRLLQTHGHQRAAVEVACSSPIVARTSLCKRAK